MKWYRLILIIVLLACGSSEESTDVKIKKGKKELIISLERTACYGTCPIYKMEVFSDGSAFYHGERFVEKEGNYEFTVSKETMDYILKKADEISFFQMEDKYTANVSDLPKTIVFSELPKTSTGKIRKSTLREQAKKL